MLLFPQLLQAAHFFSMLFWAHIRRMYIWLKDYFPNEVFRFLITNEATTAMQFLKLSFAFMFQAQARKLLSTICLLFDLSEWK